MRIDVALVLKGFVDSRGKAKTLIDMGLVKIKGIIVTKSSLLVEEDQLGDIEVLSNTLNQFVSRAGLKLERALNDVKLDVKSLNVLDIGQSTGGFTDCLLQRGAAQVVGVDVGNSQLHEKLKENPLCITIEGVNARNLKTESENFEDLKPGFFDLVVMDVSFISSAHIVPEICHFMKSGGHYLLLVKPQFEGSPDHLDRHGVVNLKKYPDFYYQLEEKMRKLCGDNIGPVSNYFESQLEGKDGNKEFFIFGKVP
jgi:23S rRNA (cytidine1920-2'-O)/16S rRNA (cytidine1409-2'-O)-methyltransferase